MSGGEEKGRKTMTINDIMLRDIAEAERKQRERAERMRINEDHLASCWMNIKKGLEDGSIELAEDKDAERKDGADA